MSILLYVDAGSRHCLGPGSDLIVPKITDCEGNNDYSFISMNNTSPD